MAVEDGEIIDAADYINDAEADPTPANNEGKVVKLENNGKFHPQFIPSGGIAFGASTAGDDDYEITVPDVDAYADGMAFAFLPDVPNTGACTLNVNSIGAKSIKRQGSTDPFNTDIVQGQVSIVVYDLANDVFRLVAPQPSSAGSSGSGSNFVSSLPKVLTHGLGLIPRQIFIGILRIGNSGSIGIYTSGVVMSRLDDGSSYSGGVLQMGPNVSNLVYCSVYADATTVEIQSGGTVGSPGTMAYQYYIKVLAY